MPSHAGYAPFAALAGARNGFYIGGAGGALLGMGLGAGVGALSKHTPEGLGYGALGGGLLGALGGSLYGGYQGWRDWSGYPSRKTTVGNYAAGTLLGGALGAGLAGAPIFYGISKAPSEARDPLMLAGAIATLAAGMYGSYLGNKMVLG